MGVLVSVVGLVRGAKVSLTRPGEGLDLMVKESRESAIFIVATPIGNLDDLTPRAAKVLAKADLIAAEDTRQTRKLLSHLGIQGKQLISYHDHNEEEKAAALVARLEQEGLQLALVSDAGTPCIADPGFRLVRAARDAGIPVHPIAGPSALTALVSASGLPSDRFMFIGFLPTKSSQLADDVASWKQWGGAAVVFFEPTRRLARSLRVIAAQYPQAQVAIGRELTKLFEEIVTMPIDEALVWLESHASLKGEATVMVKPNAGGGTLAGELAGAADHETLKKEARAAFARGASLKDLLQEYRDCGLSRSELYRLLLEARG